MRLGISLTLLLLRGVKHHPPCAAPPFSQAGDNIGLLLRGVKREDVMRGQVICKPGALKTCTVGM